MRYKLDSYCQILKPSEPCDSISIQMQNHKFYFESLPSEPCDFISIQMTIEILGTLCYPSEPCDPISIQMISAFV